MLEEYRLRLMFMELIKLACTTYSEGPYGNACSWLIEQMCMYNERFINRFMWDPGKESHECRLNNAGLKMLWRRDKKRLYITLCGDQLNLYPKFVELANKKLVDNGYYPLHTRRS